MNNPWHQRQFIKVSKRQDDHRSSFQRDRARILHSAAFRRLQSKTQVMGSGQSDFFRTRLTHSLEAAQIGSGITAQLRSKFADECDFLAINDDALIESICLAHDIGHPPFGHGGEVALHYMMREHGGFEGNGQTLRIVAKLEPFSEKNGMNLSRRTLLGLIKYPNTLCHLSHNDTPPAVANFRQLKASQWHPPKGYYSDDQDVMDWLLAPLAIDDKRLFSSTQEKSVGHDKTLYKSIDCSIMELADDIAYGIHDMEDAIVTGVVNKRDFIDHVVQPLLSIDDEWVLSIARDLADNLFSDEHYRQKDAIGSLVNYLITHIVIEDLNSAKQTNFAEPLLRYNAVLPVTPNKVLKIFKDFVFKCVIKQPHIQRIEYRGQQIVMELFEALASDPQRLLPKNTLKRYTEAQYNQENPYRVISDYVAGMTDDYATRLYRTLFAPSMSQGFYESNR
ncbi:deoxyguanosinetriphosphate triphosphohydrolase family protein [Thalassotalea sp. LPB0316]|uniref:anti-phage deoxyguanosine triphosphatase n=1 Tax=Thalassotalea sp. LPB0316 TaxID=2769490 RepID=UPI0018690004|nr:anti-phage deoxyguanosine triphosphatase [Thalassotalea sp. LPB0316]QOL24361.1 deoxyguanosinetriphosphate triphosphohydrolase family protein [Thalassotalea sp. LPB0316]